MILFIILLSAGLLLIFVNFFVKSFALDLASFACFCGILLNSYAQANEWILYMAIILMAFTLLSSIFKFCDKFLA